MHPVRFEPVSRQAERALKTESETSSMTTHDEAKKQAAHHALLYVREGMKLGLGTGSTAAFFVAALGQKVASGLKILGVPTSLATQRQAAALHIPLSTLEKTPHLDLTIDGADEFDGALRLIKGGGGALLREKIVAAASDAMIVVADASKEVARLGAFPLPVEVDRFGLSATRRHLEALCARFGDAVAAPKLRVKTDGEPFITDGGHLLFDCALRAINDPERLGQALNAVPGVVEHGLFLGMAKRILVADGQNIREIVA